MINKKNLWFLTLFSLILVLSVYYITMPSELLLTNSSDYVNASLKDNEEETSDVTVDIEESEIITTLRVTADEFSVLSISRPFCGVNVTTRLLLVFPSVSAGVFTILTISGE